MAKRANNEGTIRLRPDGLWEARYTAGCNPGTGKQIQRSIYGKSQKEVREKLQKVSVDLNEGLYLEPSKMTVSQWLDTWLKEYTKNVKPQTRASYETQIRVHIKPKLGNIRITKLTPHIVQVFINSLLERTDDTPALKPKSIKNVNSVLYGAMTQAVILGYIRSNPCVHVSLPRVETAEMHPLNATEMSAFLRAIKKSEYETMFIVTMFTGMRLGEVTGLTWDRIDFDAGTILIDRQLMRERRKGGQYILVAVKNDHPRKLTPAPFVMGLLRQHKSEQSLLLMKTGALWDQSGIKNLVFTTAFGRHLIHSTITHNIKRIATSIGIRSFCFHDLRHTYAVNALRAGDDVKTVQSNLGHATAAFTLDRYGHFTDDMRRDSAARMEAFAKSVINQ